MCMELPVGTSRVGHTSLDLWITMGFGLHITVLDFTLMTVYADRLLRYVLGYLT